MVEVHAVVHYAVVVQTVWSLRGQLLLRPFLVSANTNKMNNTDISIRSTHYIYFNCLKGNPQCSASQNQHRTSFHV